jgi:hypothetical protein
MARFNITIPLALGAVATSFVLLLAITGSQHLRPAADVGRFP